jgi:hypothetical protein
MNVAVYNFVPSFCANCGQPCRLSARDYAARCTFICSKCGLNHQLVDRDKIVAAARADGGDLE